MDFYGINMEGPFHGERVLTLPVWTSDDEGREIYTLDTEKKYYGTSTGWVQYADYDSVVLRADFGANTILKADTDDLPVTLTVGTNTIVGRYTGSISALTPTQVRTIINVENNADVTDYDNVSLAGAVMKTAFDANTILKADTDDLPVTLTVEENRIIGRYGSGNIEDLTAMEVRDILNVEDGADVTDYDNVSLAGAVMETDFDANTILKADTDDLPITLTINTNEIVGRISGGVIDGLTPTQVRTIINVENGADVTDYDNVSLAGAVMKTAFDANTILKADTDDLPVTLTVGTNTIVGRYDGNISALDPEDVRSIINVEDGADVTDAVNIASSVHGVAEKTVLANADEFALVDSVSSYVLKKITWEDMYDLFNIGLYLNKVSKTDDYSVLTTDRNTIIELGPTTAANKTFTLPSVSSANDGYIYLFLNNSEYKLTIAASDTDSIWNSGAGYGIEILDKGTLVALRYDHANTKFDIIQKTGGRVIVEGLKFHIPMNRMYLNDIGSDNSECDDVVGLHYGKVISEIDVYDETYSKFEPGCYFFDGTGVYIKFTDSTDWDVFGTQTGVKTISGWVYNDTVTRAYDYWISHYEDANNYWMVYTSSTGYPKITYKSASTSYIDTASSTIMTADTWTHVALVINESSVGLYIDGILVVYDDSWSTDTFSGYLYLANFSGGTSSFLGRMQDWFFAYNNVFDASPDSGLTDTITIPTKPMQLTM